MRYLLFADLLLLGHECDQVFPRHGDLLRLGAVGRRLGRVRVLLALILVKTLLPPLRSPLPPPLTALLLPAEEDKETGWMDDR